MDLNLIFKNKLIFFVTLFLILLIGLFFRLNYYDDGLWSDEWISYYISNLNLNLIEKYSYHIEFEGASPINLFINTFISKFFGIYYQNYESVYLFFSIIFLIISLNFFESKKEKIFYLLLLSLNPFLIYFSGELRFYSFSVLFSCLSFLAFVKLNEEVNKVKIFLFFICTLICLLINFYTISLILSFLIFSFIKKKKSISYLIILILLIFFLISFDYLFNVSGKYQDQFGDGGGNINFKFFIGYFFNIFFGDKVFGAISLIIFFSSIYWFKNKLLINNKLLLSYLIIFTTYLMFITYSLLIKNIFFPRHFIFIVPFIIFIICSFIFDIKKEKIKMFLIIFFLIMSFFVNFKSNKPYLTSKPDPNEVNKKILNSEVKNIYIPIIKKINYIDKSNCCFFNELLFTSSQTFKKNYLNIIIGKKYENYDSFWTICIVEPTFRRKSDPKKVENCYGKLKHLNDSYKIKETFSKNEFTASLYEKKNNLSK